MPADEQRVTVRMRPEHFEWLADEAGLRGLVRQVYQLRLVELRADPEIAAECHLSEERVAELADLAVEQLHEWERRLPSDARQRAREILECLANVRNVRVGRTRGEPKPSRGHDDDPDRNAKQIVAGAPLRSPVLTEDDLLPPRLDHPLAAAYRGHHQERERRIAAQRAKNTARRQAAIAAALGEIPAEPAAEGGPAPRNRAERRALQFGRPAPAPKLRGQEVSDGERSGSG